jgi:4-hydroxy-3-methylbut-2-en-1-yl diphosphate reductase
VTAVALCTPTLTEAKNLRRGLAQCALKVTGIGPRRSSRVLNGGSLDGLLVAGVGGGLAPSLRSGDVVVASEVRGPDGSRPCASASMLAAQLRRAGLSVHIGPVVSVDHIVAGYERNRLAASGALAVDMESSWLADQAPQAAALAVVRVVADPADAPLWRPATLGRLAHALSRLSLLGPALEAWCAAVDERRILLPGPRSFCAGVIRAIDIVSQALLQRGAPIYVRKEIVHNRHVVAELRRLGAVFVDELCDVPDGSTVVFSAHGVAPSVRAEAARRGLQVIDATCPLVSKVHAEARRFADDDHTIFFIGHRGHEETVGTMGERPDRTVLVETVADAERVQVVDRDRVSYLVQTTLAADEVDGIVAALRRRFPALRAPASDDICYATTNRQLALRAVASEADSCLVVGSANSSNSQRLAELAKRSGTPAHLVDDVSGIDLRWLAGARTVAITAGASAPTSLIDEIVASLSGLGPVHVEHRNITEETTTFTLPKEIRPR